MKQTRGVYFLAHDGIIDLAIAFLNSFRTYNPELALCLIPYNSDVEKLSRLRELYNFEVFDDRECLSHCDRVSQAFLPAPCGQFRKLAAWDGIFDEFIYVDVDTIVLHSFDFGFDYLAEYGFVTAHSDVANNRKWVWKDSIYSAPSGLTAAQIAYSGNTGFIISRRGLLSRHAVSRQLAEGIKLAEHMELFCTEQPLLNYLIVTSGVSFTSLLEISRRNDVWNIPLERWSGKWFGLVFCGTVICGDKEAPMLMVHWAGEWQRGMHEESPLWRYYRDMEVQQLCGAYSRDTAT